MMRSKPHNRLNAKQLRTLRLIYRFRFVTIPLLSQYKKTSLTPTKRSLALLKSQGYIDKQFKKEYRMAGKAARYYIATEGRNELKGKDGIDDLILHAMYKNPSMHESSVDRYLYAMELYIKLEKDYPSKFEIYTKVETTHVDGFLEPTPDLYLKGVDESKPSYFLELQSASQVFVLKMRIQAYIEHYDTGDWEDGDYPSILVVCDTPQSERTIQEFAAKVLESTGIEDEMTFLTTTLHALRNNTKEIWTNPVEPDKLFSLNNNSSA